MQPASATTPLMKQYWEIKSLYPEQILLYRMGDFYEMFFDDAVKAAPILGIALTSRNKKGGDETPMCGVPQHAAANIINRLLQHGLKVAICDQLEDPKGAKGLVKRGVTRVLTPGMVYDLDSLEAGQAHYLASLDEGTLSLVDVSTGESFYFHIESENEARRILDLIPVAEIVLDEARAAGKDPWPAVLSVHEPLEGDTALPVSARRLLAYVRASSGEEILRILKPFESRSWKGRLHLSSTVLRHLEIFQTYRGEGVGSLFHAVDRTQTSIGRRLLRQWLSFPLTDAAAITERQEFVQAWKARPAELKRVRQVLAGMGDLERRLGKMPHSTCNGRDLQSLAHSVQAGLQVLEMAGGARAVEAMTSLRELSEVILGTLVDEPPLQVKQGHLIRSGFRQDLDELIDLSTNAQALLQKMENEEREKTGIPSLKIRYNNVFGYYIEITNVHRDKAPARYRRKQTLANAERYCTDELLELERKVLSAQTRRSELEYEIFESLRQRILGASPALLTLAQRCGEIDVLSALAWLSLEENYARPKFHAGQSLSLKSSRHPVVEQSVRKSFVPNDIELGDRACLLLTGPNMAGKSTLMRQVALTAILAQIGSDVPAREARLPLFEALYTRIGASDQLSEGLSTFMVEMVETAQMLKSANGRSLVVLDEVGRGTSTFDGMCLAQAILEHILGEVRCLTLFATHYHELTILERDWPQVQNAHMSVTERGGEVRFLHTLVKGPALKSYGIQVAELAGLPSSITRRAKALLKEIENGADRPAAATQQLSLLAVNLAEPVTSDPRQEFLRKISEELRELPISKMTPLEALNRLAQWQETWRDPS